MPDHLHGDVLSAESTHDPTAIRIETSELTHIIKSDAYDRLEKKKNE